MADSTARARDQISGHRKAISEHIDKWRRYRDPNDKNFRLEDYRERTEPDPEAQGPSPFASE